jgi:hypothetical protein
MSSMVISRPRAGMDRSASPASPPAATSVVARIAIGWVTSDDPAVALGATNGVQLSVPRSSSVSDVHCVVTPEDSMKSRNGGLMRPSSTRATAHQVTARAEASTHHAVNRHHRRFGRWQAHQISAGRHPVRVATALTAPINASAIPARAARTRSGLESGCPRSARITGSSTHGASIIGSVSEEIDPSVVSTRGDSAKATAPISRDVGLPMFSASATRSSPQQPAVSSSAHHTRWVTQPGTPRVSPSRKKAPWGKR